jgi:thiol-disulfide isomerase/thioredoxin
MYSIFMTKKIIFYMLAVVLILGLSGCAKEAEQASAPVQEQKPSVQTAAAGQGGSLLIRKGHELASITGVTLKGEQHGPSLLKNSSVTMLNVWTTTCPYCIDEMPILEEVSLELRAEGLQIIGIIGDGMYNKNAALGVIDRTGVTYLNIVPEGTFTKTIMDIAYAVPTTIFIDSDGRMIGEPILGARSKEFFLEQARSALAGM